MEFDWQLVQDWLQDRYNLYMLAALIVAVILLIILVKWRRSHRPIVPFRAQGGRVEIAPRTLRNLIDHAVMGVPGVEKLRSKFGTKKRKLYVHVYLDLMATAKLPEVEAELKHRIREALRNQFGLENIGEIDVTVRKIVGDPPVAPRTPLLEHREEEPEPHHANAHSTTTTAAAGSHLVSHTPQEPKQDIEGRQPYDSAAVSETGSDATETDEDTTEEEADKKRLG
ncbi:MAG: hypothetical protein E1N59_2091 [Puniceicoccaceae bacterium 5H]|nr:MAG: hypothetical protein E1N59_2091 [Puniceicoccaceae bacterium 5H]